MLLVEFAKNGDLPVVSLDEIRRRFKISPTDKNKNGWVVQQAKERAKQYLRSKTPFVWNATNITLQMRAQLIELFTTYRAWVKIEYLEVPYKKLLHQNRNREYAVPENVINRLIDKLEIPTLSEGHEIIFHIET